MQTEGNGFSFPWIKGLRHEPILLSSSTNEWSYASTPTQRVLHLWCAGYHTIHCML